MFRKTNDNGALETIRVLLIDGDPTQAGLVDRSIQKHSSQYTLLTSNRLAGGIDILERDRIDIVLVNLFLQDSSGLNTLTAVYDVSPDTAVIVLTDAEGAAVTLSALDQCGQSYLIKGKFDSTHLFNVIHNVLEIRAANKARSRVEIHPSDFDSDLSAPIDCWRDLQNRSARDTHTRTRILRNAPRMC